MTEDVFEQDLGEKEYYHQTRTISEEIQLPMTRIGFEALLEFVCINTKVPYNDKSRAVLAGYIHHIPGDKDTVELGTLHRVLRKSVANDTSWRIDQEIKIKNKSVPPAPPLTLVEPQS